MMIQPSSTHFQHPRQPSQNYAHCVNSYRQNGYQVSIVKGLKSPFLLPAKPITQNAIRHGIWLSNRRVHAKTNTHNVVTQSTTSLSYLFYPFSSILVKHLEPQNVIISACVYTREAFFYVAFEWRSRKDRYTTAHDEDLEEGTFLRCRLCKHELLRQIKCHFTFLTTPNLCLDVWCKH